MRTRILKRSFIGGEITPELFDRIGLAKVINGLKRAENLLITPYGSAVRRPGTAFVAETQTSAIKTRLIPFVFNINQAYAIELGQGYFRFHAQGATVLQGSPAAWVSTTAYTSGQLVSYNGSNYYAIQASTGQTPDTAYAYWYLEPSNGFLEVPNGFLAAELFDVHYAQLGDVLTLTHPSHAVAELTRIGATTWTVTLPDFGMLASTVGALTATATTGTPPTGVTANPVTEAYAVSSVDEKGNQSKQAVTSASNDLTITGSHNDLSWADSARRNFVYKLLGGAYGFIGDSTSGTFVDNFIAPDMSRTPPQTDAVDLFSAVNDFPAAVSYYQQRRWFGGTNDLPEGLWATRVGGYDNMSYSLPAMASDRIAVQMAAHEVNAIRHFIPMQDLIILTAAGSWLLTGTGGSRSPVDATIGGVVLTQQAFVGASNVVPVVHVNRGVFCAQKGSHVWEFGYQWQSRSYVPSDLSLLATHLFDSYEMMDMTKTVGSVPIIWVVRNDGTLLAMTYVPLQEVSAWGSHTTDGVIESVTSIPETDATGATEDYLYWIVQRTINGVVVRYVERMRSRFFENAEDAFFVDSGITQMFGAPVTTVSGLSWLEGKSVAILADGAVVPPQVVTGGAITLPTAAVKVTLGLPYTHTLELPPLAQNTDPAMLQGRMKGIERVFVRVIASGGIAMGPSVEQLIPYPPRATEPYGTPPVLKSGELEMLPPLAWNPEGTFVIQGSDPLPLEVTGITLELSVGGG